MCIKYIFMKKFKSSIFPELEKRNWYVRNGRFDSKSNLFKFDEIASIIEKDKENKEILKRKISNFGNKKKDYKNVSQTELSPEEQEQNEQLFDFFVELKAYEELSRRGFVDLKFSEGNLPDLKGFLDGTIYYIEVKNLRIPKEEIDAFYSDSFSEHKETLNKETKEEAEKFIKIKISEKIEDSLSKFNSVNTNISNSQKILFINYNPSVFVYFLFKGKDLVGIFGKNYFIQLETNKNITIELKNYFNF